ncbi:hypothetical protein ACHQM5_021401 [Ranunculus cassubicifolius]
MSEREETNDSATREISSSPVSTSMVNCQVADSSANLAQSAHMRHFIRSSWSSATDLSTKDAADGIRSSDV